MMGRSRVAALSIATVAVSVLLAACGSAKSATSGGGGSAAETGIQAVYSQLKGLTGQARTDKLIELAKAEGGAVNFYHSGTFTDMLKDFTTKTGIKVNDYTATSEQVSTRVANELKAKKVGSDLVLGSFNNLITLDNGGAIAPLQTPALGTVAAQYKYKDLIATFGAFEIPTYNTTKLTAADQPKSWQDFFENFKGSIGIEESDWQWFQTLVQDYFVKQKGMTEDAAIKLITNGLKGATIINGHTLEASLLTSGQYDYAPAFYAQNVKKGSPLSYAGLSQDMPPLADVGVLGLSAGAAHPAAGLLLLEYYMGKDGQTYMVEKQNREPTSSVYEGQTLLKQFPKTLFVVDPEHLLSAAEQKQWQDKWDTLLQQLGGKRVDK